MPAGSSYWVPEGMLDAKLFNADIDRDGKIDHICFSISNKFLHPNHPIGWVRNLTVLIDDAEIDPEQIFFVIRKQWIPLKYVPTIRDIWWHMLEKAEIYIKSDGYPVGSEHDLACKIDISLLVHTENLDRNNLFPCLHCELNEHFYTQEDII